MKNVAKTGKFTRIRSREEQLVDYIGEVLQKGVRSTRNYLLCVATDTRRACMTSLRTNVDKRNV